MLVCSDASAFNGADAPFGASLTTADHMAKKSTLQLRKLSPDLLGRVNAYIELLGVDREDFFRDLLDNLTKELKPVQTKLRKDYEAGKLKGN